MEILHAFLACVIIVVFVLLWVAMQAGAMQDSLRTSNLPDIPDAVMFCINLVPSIASAVVVASYLGGH